MTVHRIIDTIDQPRLRPNPAAERARQLADHNAHNVTMSAMIIALAKHFVVAADDETAKQFIDYFVEQSRQMAAITGEPMIATFAEQKTSQLADMLLAKRQEVRGGRG